MIRDVLIVIALAGFAVFVSACDDDGTTTDTGPKPTVFDLTFTGTIAPHAGQTLHVLVLKDGDGAIQASETETVAGDGTFSFSWPDLLDEGESYHIDFYADHNSSGSCESPPTDHAWRETIGAVSGNVSRDFQHNTNFTDVCASFSFDLTFTGTIGPHAGQDFHVAVIDMSSSNTVQTDQVVVAVDGTYEFMWPGILEHGHSYQIDFYADHNGSGDCDSPPTDHTWRRMTGTIGGPTEVDFQHDTNFTDVCASFP